ncbi:MAG: nodulation protein NfeD [Candidatus Omnitrophota bacterium]
MMKRLICLFFIVALFLLPSTALSQNFVYSIQLEDDTINPITAEYIINAIDQAESDEAQALVLKLDTPGGLLNSTRKIVKSIIAARTPVVVYIAPGGSRAGSAGVFLTYASHIAAMAPSTNIGAAHPVQLGDSKKDRSNLWDEVKKILESQKEEGDAVKEGEKTDKKVSDNEPITSGDDPMSDKILNDTVAFIRSLAEQRGRNIEWAVQSVVKSASITETEALEKKVVEIIAVSDEDLLMKLNGRTVIVNGREVTLNTSDATVKKIEMSQRQKLFNILANPNIAYILMILGFYGLLYEVTNPGIGVPGVAGFLFLVLAFFSMQTLPTNYAGLALVVLGLILFIAEPFVPGFGLPTLGGLISLVLGSFLLFDTSVPFMRVSLSLIIPFALSTAAFTIFLIQMVLKAHFRKVFSGAEGMIGLKGESRTVMVRNGHGKVFVHGEIWNAVAEEDIPSGTEVIVTKVDGLLLTVKKQS